MIIVHDENPRKPAILLQVFEVSGHPSPRLKIIIVKHKECRGLLTLLSIA
ncbi:hypothetical protein J7L29_01370 [Candidatus Bathyarchaeota archaeon]|nr:hypothetical protein [Candidatus Bathyarchaeota archaeon]